MKVIGLDGGFGFTKYFDGTNLEKIVSLVSPARRIRFNFDFNKRDARDILHIGINGNEYFVGNFAREQGINPLQVLDKDKVYHEATSVLMKTVLGLFPKENDLRVVMGLPVSFYDDKNKEHLERVIKRRHSIVFYQNQKEGKERRFEVKDVLVIPQPIGSLFDVLLNDTGAVKKGEQNLAKLSIAIIDIGFGTTDFAVIKELEYIDKSSRSIGIGVKDVLETIREEIAYVSREELPLYEVERLVTSGRDEVSIKGKTYNIKEITKKAAADVFVNMKTISNYLWDKEKTIDLYVLTGGGLYLLKDEFKNFYGNKISTLFINNPMFSNVRGFYKYGLRKWAQ